MVILVTASMWMYKPDTM